MYFFYFIFDLIFYSQNLIRVLIRYEIMCCKKRNKDFDETSKDLEYFLTGSSFLQVFCEIIKAEFFFFYYHDSGGISYFKI